MANTTANQTSLIRQQIYSTVILRAIQDGFLPSGFFRDISDFGDGDTLYVPTLGEMVIRDIAEDNNVIYDPLDSGRVSLTINQFKAVASYVTGKLDDDSYLAADLRAAIPMETLRKIAEAFETDMLAQANKQTLSNPNLINGFAHRWVADTGTTATVISLEDFAYAKLSLDKAEVPTSGRIAIVDPIVEMTLNKLAGTQAFINNPRFEGVVNTGMAKDMRFLWNIMGFDVYTSNRLPRVTETITGGPGTGANSVTDGVVNQFMCVADDMCKPYMGAWRRQPDVHVEYNKDKDREESVTYARWGFGLQRSQTLCSVLTSSTLYS